MMFQLKYEWQEEIESEETNNRAIWQAVSWVFEVETVIEIS